MHQDKFTYVSSGIKQLLGYEIEEWTDFQSWINMLHEDDKQRISNYCENETRDGRNHTMEYRMVKKNGEVIWVLDVVRLGKDENEKTVTLSGVILDVTDRKNKQLKIEQEHKFLQTIINGISDPVMIINDDYSVDIMNDKVRKTLAGRIFMDPSSPKCYEISHYQNTPCDGENDPCPLKYVLENKKATKVMHNHKHEDGSDHFVELAASPLFDECDNCVGIIESARDITSYVNLTQELEEKTKLLSYEATHDYLTGLPNRALFMDRLEQSMKDAHRNKSPLALFFMDLDNFKLINDSLGHHTGDAVLKEVCEKFSRCIRANDVLSRLGGDEFTVIVKGVPQEEDIISVAQKILDEFKEPTSINGQLLKLSVSIGISQCAYNIETPDKLLQKADGAMYKAKAKGKNNFAISPSIV